MQDVAVVIGASAESVFAINRAKMRGLKVAAFDGDSKAAGLKIADFGFVCDIKDPKNIIEILKQNCLNPLFVLPVPIGRFLITTGAINEYFKIKNTDDFNTLNLCTDKLAFHNALNGGGVRELFGRKIGVMKQNLRDINCEIITKNFTPKEFPLIIKPRFGSGSRDVMVCFNKDEFDKILSQIDVFKEDFLAETLVFGTEIGVDGVVIDGVFKSVLMREKIITPYPFRQCVANVAINEVLAVSKHIQKAVARLGIKNSLLNADVIIKDDGSVFIIELAPRPSGHYLSSVFLRLVTGVSLLDEWLNFMQNLPFDFTPKFYKQALIKYFDFDFEIDEFMRLKDEFKIVKYECNNSQNLGEVKDGKSIMNRGFAVILGSDKNECIKHVNELIKTLKKA